MAINFNRGEGIHFAVVASLLFAPCLLGFGCERIEGRSSEIGLNASPNKESPSQDKMMVDIGILFADREQILCLPLAKLGITRAAQVRSIVSSCDCIVPTVRDYAEPDGQMAVALEILHAKSHGGAEPTMRLNVQVEIEAACGQKKSIELICTLAKGNRE